MLASAISTCLNLARLIGKSSIALITILGVWTATAQAHETRPAVLDVVTTSERANMTMTLIAEPLLAGIDLSAFADTDDAPQAEEYDRLRALDSGAFQAQVEAAWPQIAAGFMTQGMGDLELVSVAVLAEDNLELPRDTVIQFTAALPAGDDPIALGWQAENGGLVVRHGAGDDAYAGFLEGGEISVDLPRTGGVQETAGQTFWRFIVEGFEHILPKGLDHILFVLGLFMFALAWRPLLAQVTTFTLAHTVTLGLATLGVITIPGDWMWAVEALIALSITYVAVENILRPRLGWWRIVVVFVFGLLHGLGFASVLGDLGLAQGQFILSLIAFNIGVELGQLFVIAVAFALLVIAVRAARMGDLNPGEEAVRDQSVLYRAVSLYGSITIALIGVYWVIERTLF